MRDTTKADLAAANREVRSVMDQNAALKKESAAAYHRGYREGVDVFRDIMRAQGDMIIALMERLGNARP
jgi:hypothetical protein